jgi:DNA-binding protein HU-beta
LEQALISSDQTPSDPVSGEVLTDFTHRCADQSNLRLQLRFLEIARFCCHKPRLEMTKAELQIALAAATQTNKSTSGVFLDTLSNLAYKAIKKNGEFVLLGFGKLVKQKRKARTGFNPKTQQKIKIPAKTVVKFRVAKVAKDAILGVKK